MCRPRGPRLPDRLGVSRTTAVGSSARPTFSRPGSAAVADDDRVVIRSEGDDGSARLSLWHNGKRTTLATPDGWTVGSVVELTETGCWWRTSGMPPAPSGPPCEARNLTVTGAAGERRTRVLRGSRGASRGGVRRTPAEPVRGRDGRGGRGPIRPTRRSSSTRSRPIPSGC